MSFFYTRTLFYVLIFCFILSVLYFVSFPPPPLTVSLPPAFSYSIPSSISHSTLLYRKSPLSLSLYLSPLILQSLPSPSLFTHLPPILSLTSLPLCHSYPSIFTPKTPDSPLLSFHSSPPFYCSVYLLLTTWACIRIGWRSSSFNQSLACDTATT